MVPSLLRGFALLALGAAALWWCETRWPGGPGLLVALALGTSFALVAPRQGLVGATAFLLPLVQHHSISHPTESPVLRDLVLTTLGGAAAWTGALVLVRLFALDPKAKALLTQVPIDGMSRPLRPQPRRRLPPWLATVLVCFVGLLVAAAVGALEGEAWLRGAPTLMLGMSLGFFIGAAGCGIGFRALWSEYPAREELPEDAPADDWWRPSIPLWVARATFALPRRFVPPPGEGPTRQLPACSLSLRVIATGSMILHLLFGLGVLLFLHSLLDVFHWATGAE